MKKIVLLFSLCGIVFSSNAQLQAPVLRTPADNSINIEPEVTLNWRPALGGPVANYDIEIDDNPSFTSPLAITGVQATTTTVNELIFNETYYWRVRANPIVGVVSFWSAVFQFTTLDDVILAQPGDFGESDTARASITINDINRLKSDTIEFDGHRFAEGTDFNVGIDANATATNLTNAMNAISAITDKFRVEQDGARIKLSSDEPGAAFNSVKLEYEYVQTDTMLTPDAQMTGGTNTDTARGEVIVESVLLTDNYRLFIGNPAVDTITAGVDFTVGGNKATTATNIANAINTKSTDVTATTLDSAVMIKAVAHGTARNYVLVYEDFGAGVLNSATTLQGGNDPIINVETDISWTAIDGATKYQYQYDTDSAFNSPNALTGIVDAPEKKATITSLRFNSEYYWRVRAIHGKDTSNYSSDFFSFVTPRYITPFTPAADAAGISPDTLLTVLTMKGVDQYEMEIDSNATINIASNEFRHELTSDPEFGVSELLFGQSYHWRVRGINSNDTSEWNAPWSFTTANTVTQTSPADGADSPQQVVFEWQKLQGVMNYQIQLDDEVTLATPDEFMVTNGEGTFTNSQILPLGTYYWRIRAYHSRDTSDWSPIRSFNSAPVGIEEEGSKASVLVFPNPVVNELNIQLENMDISSDLTVLITDIRGKMVMNKRISVSSSSDRKSINLESIKNGIYMVTIQNDAYYFNEKIVISK